MYDGCFELEDGRLHYRMREGEKPALMMLHGTGGHCGSFNFLVERLSKREIILPDLRGHGDSMKPKSQYTTEEYSQDIYNLITGLGYETAILGGFSLGALIAIDVASRFPKIVSALILVEPSIGTDWKVLEDKIKAFGMVPEGFDNEEEARAYLKNKYEGISSRQLENEMNHAFSRSEDGRIYWKYSRDAAIKNFKNRRENNLPKIFGISCPTLIIRADNSEMFSVDYYNKIKKTGKSNIKLTTVKGCDHRILFQKPEELTKIITSFLTT